MIGKSCRREREEQQEVLEKLAHEKNVKEDKDQDQEQQQEKEAAVCSPEGTSFKVVGE